MEKKAKLRYDGISYFDKDLVRICTEEAQYYGGVFSSYTIDRNHEVILITMNIKSDINQCLIRFERLKDAMSKKKEKKEVVKLEYDNKKYTDSMLSKIGNKMAEDWGGTCINYSINRNLERVIFNCVENGEPFQTDIAFYNLKKY